MLPLQMLKYSCLRSSIQESNARWGWSALRLHTDPSAIERKYRTGTHCQVGLNDVGVGNRGSQGVAGLKSSRWRRHTKVDLIESGEAWRCAGEQRNRVAQLRM